MSRPGAELRQRSEQSAVRKAHRFDEPALLDYLANVVPGFSGPMSVAQFTGGQSNPTFLLETPSDRFVLRKKPPGKLLPTAHAIEREYRVLKALEGSSVPVPHVLHFCESESVIGTPFYLMEYRPGRILRNPLLPGMGAGERAAVYDAMNRTLADLHGVDWRAVGLEDFGKPGHYLARQVALWSRQYQASRTGDVAAMDELMEWLPDHVPADDSAAIVHGDFRLENLVFDAREPRVIAVLDWELSTLGHPLSDLAYNAMAYYLPSDSDVAPGFAGADIAALGIPSEQQYVAVYCRRTGRGAVEDWPFYLVFSLFRAAAIQQGVYARALKGNASSVIAEKFGALDPLVAERGRALIHRGTVG
jgi:aminoglycoside phosphotransferase (APT) family kinase protein